MPPRRVAPLLPLLFYELLIRLELTDAVAPVGLYLQSTQPSFDKEGFRGRQFCTRHITKNKCYLKATLVFRELLIRLELTTSSLPRKCSTTELQQPLTLLSGAKVENKIESTKKYGLFLQSGRKIISLSRPPLPSISYTRSHRSRARLSLASPAVNSLLAKLLLDA